MAQSASDVAKPVSLPENGTRSRQRLGKRSRVRIDDLFTLRGIQRKCVSEDQVRNILTPARSVTCFREFPLDSKATVASILARCIAKDDAGKYFAVIDMMFKKLDEWSLPAIRFRVSFVLRYPWHERRVVETCLKDQALFDKLSADDNFAHKVLEGQCERRPSSLMPRGSKAQSRSKSLTSGSNNC